MSVSLDMSLTKLFYTVYHPFILIYSFLLNFASLGTWAVGNIFRISNQTHVSSSTLAGLHSKFP